MKTNTRDGIYWLKYANTAYKVDTVRKNIVVGATNYNAKPATISLYYDEDEYIDILKLEVGGRECAAETIKLEDYMNYFLVKANVSDVEVNIVGLN